jgi:translocation and assembly module TamB
MAVRRKWLWRLLVAVPALVLLLAAIVVAMLDSETGTRWIIEQIARRVPGEIRLQQFSGTLWSGLRIPVAGYRDSDREVTASGLAIDIDWSGLSTARIAFSDLSSGSVVYRSLAGGSTEPRPLQVAMPPLPIAITATRIDIGEFRMTSAASDFSLRGISIADLRLLGNRIDAASAAASADLGSLRLNGLATQLDGDVPISASIAWQDGDKQWSGRGQLGGSLAQLEFDQRVSGPYPATAEGTVRLLRRTEPLIDATVQWMDWRLGPYQAQSGRVHVVGYLPAYEANFDVRVADQDDHSARISGSASGDAAGLSTLRATADSAIGRLDAEGSLAWSPALSSVLRISGRDLDLSQIFPLPQTDIGVDLTLEIERRNSVVLTVHSIEGSYKEEAFRARGRVSRTDQVWQCTQCELGIGANRAVIQGTINNKVLALSGKIDAPSLDQLWPGLGGSVSLDGTMQGTLMAPVFTGRALGESLSWSGWQIARFSVTSRASSLQELHLSALIEDLRQRDRPLGTFDILLTGALAALDSRVRWELSGFSAEAAGTLDLSSDYAQGSVDTAEFNQALAGSWNLMNAFRFSSGQNSIEIGPHAWKNGDAAVTVNALRVSGSETRIDANLQHLPLAVFQPALPDNSEVSGYADSLISLRLNNGEWFGSVSWDQQQTRLRMSQLDEQPIDIVIPVARVDARLLGGTAEATAAVEIDPGLSATLRVSVAALTADPDIEAHFEIDGRDWYWIPAVFPEIDNFEGTIVAEMDARGPLREPNLGGELRWRDGRLVIPALSVPISDIDLSVSGSSSGQAAIKGTARAGGGELAVDGLFDDLMLDSRSFTVHLTGKNAELLDWPEYKLTASPDVVVSGSFAGVSVNGRIDVPRAEIAVRRIPEESVKPSADVTVVGRTAQPETAVPVTGAADIVLGKNIHVQALGLDSKLGGRLRVTATESRSLRAEGELTLVEGVFEAYGQRLTITEGSMLFTGPLDNPFVKVRAVRTIETIDGTVTAGIELRGPAQNLVASVFSEPSMAESDALSYLVLGRPLQQSTAVEGSQLSGAAVALGLRQATRITNQIGQAFGLDQLEVAGDGSSTTALVAGKQVSSRLYLRYAYGVFSQLGSVLLRYRLSRRLTLETSTGESQSMDLLYIVEKP